MQTWNSSAFVFNSASHSGLLEACAVFFRTKTCQLIIIFEICRENRQLPLVSPVRVHVNINFPGQATVSNCRAFVSEDGQISGSYYSPVRAPHETRGPDLPIYRVLSHRQHRRVKRPSTIICRDRHSARRLPTVKRYNDAKGKCYRAKPIEN